MEENESFQDPISLEELELLSHHPSSTHGTTNNSIFHSDDPVTSLSHIPWTFQQSIQIASEEPTSSSISDKFPSFSYLDLRRHQNRAWANDRLRKGNEKYYLDPEQADKLYQEGIDLVPDHVDLLVAQAKLWLMRRSRPLLQSAKSQLKNALQLDATHADAKHWMTRLEQHEAAIAAARRGDGGGNHQAQTRNSTAYQNVLMERNLLIASLQNDEEPTHSESSSSHRRSQRHKKKKEKKKRRKHKKESKNKGRKRRRRYDSLSASEESSIDSSIGSGRMSGDGTMEEEKDAVPIRARKSRTRKRHYSDASSTSGNDDSAVKSSRNMEQKEPDRQRDDSSGDDDTRSHRRHKKRSRSYREKSKHRKKHRMSEIRSDSQRESNNTDE